MKYYQSSSTVKNPWEEVLVAFWQRYPNPYSRHVLSEDTVSRQVNPQTSQISSIRVLSKTNRMPKWGERLTSARQVVVIEESLLDLVSRTFTTVTRNLGYTKILSVKEKCTYEPDPANPTSFTLVKREAWVDSGLKGFSTILTRFGIERFKSNANGATKGLAHVLARLFPHRNCTDDTSSTAMSTLSAKIDSTSAKLIEKVAKTQSGGGEVL